MRMFEPNKSTSTVQPSEENRQPFFKPVTLQRSVTPKNSFLGGSNTSGVPLFQPLAHARAASTAGQSTNVEEHAENNGNQGPNNGTKQGPLFTSLLCSPQQRGEISKAKTQATNMVNIALFKLYANIDQARYTRHFGASANIKTVISRFEHILKNLNNKNFVCPPSCDSNVKATFSDSEEGEGVPTGQLNDPGHICGYAPCSGNTIFLCPIVFAKSNKKSKGQAASGQSCPLAKTIIHEAAHNAGACQDVMPGSSNYPPLNAEDNAWSYEMFAS